MFEDQHLSYGELNDALTSWRTTCAAWVGAEDVVGICVERSVELVVAGAGDPESRVCLLPLDLANPRERRAHAGGCGGAVGGDATVAAGELAKGLQETFCLDGEWPTLIERTAAMRQCWGRRRLRVPDLYVGVDGQAERGDDQSLQRGAVVSGEPADFEFGAEMYGRCFTPPRSIFRCGNCGVRCCMGGGWWWCRTG